MQVRNSLVLHRFRAVLQRRGSALLPLLALTSTLFCGQIALASEPQTQISLPVQPISIASSALPISNAAKPVVHLQNNDLRGFDTAFAALSEQGKVAFVAEGKPFVSTLSDEDLEKLTKSLPTGEAATFREVTDLVAHAYDYDVVHLPAQPGLVLLVKRHSDPKDFPMVSYEEAERSLHNILLATDPINPRGPDFGQPGSPFNRLYASLSAEQRANMATHTPVAVSAMRPDQRQLVWQMAYQHYFTWMEIFDNVYARLKGLEDPRTEFCWMDWTAWLHSEVPLFVFGWEGPFGPNHGNEKVALSHLSMAPGGPTGLSIPRAAAIASGLLDPKTFHLLKPLPDNGTEPPPANATLKQTAAEPDPNTLTLREAVQRLNETAASAPPKLGEDVFRAAVDDALARKTVTLIGTQTTPPFSLLDAFGRVYGLWIVAQKDESFLLTLRTPRVCKEVADVPQEIRRLFPEPMWRAMENGARNFENSNEEQMIRKQREAAKVPKRRPLSEEEIKWNAFMDARNAKQAQIRMRAHAAEAMNFESIRRIRALVEPLVPKNSGRRLPAVQVSEAAHDALAIFHLTQAVQALDAFRDKTVPSYLLHFDRATVLTIVGTPDGPDRAALHLGTIDEKIGQSSTSVYFQLKPQ